MSLLTDQKEADGVQLEEQDGQGYNNNLSTNSGEASAAVILAPAENPEEFSNEAQEEDEFSCDSCFKSFLRRGWMLIFFATVLGFDVGFWVYLSTGYPQYIAICCILGFVIGFIIDEYLFASRRTVVESEEGYIQDADIKRKFEREEGCNFYAQTDIYSRFFHRYRGSSRVYRKNNSGSIVFQRKYVFFFRDYRGYEMGFGFVSFISLIIAIIAYIIIVLLSDINIGPFVLFFIFVIILILIAMLGGFFEWCLRKENIISPLNGSITQSISVPIHEIRDIQCLSIGYHATRSNLVKRQLGCWYCFVIWFRFLLYCFRFLMYIGRLIRINAAFFLWLLVFLFTALLFVLIIDKGDQFLLQFTLGGIIIILILHIMFLFFLHMPFCGFGDRVKCGNSCNVPKYSIMRIPATTQTIFFFVLLASCIAVFIAAVCLAIINEQVYEEAQKFFTEFEQSVVIADRMVCKAGRRRLLSGTLAENLCETPRKELLILAVVCMCLSWNILLLLAFWWYMVDQYFVIRKAKEIVGPVWQKYSQLKITRARNRICQMFSPTVIIELAEEQALALMTYLANVCPYAQLPTTIGIAYDGGFQYVNRFGAIGGQPFGNDSGKDIQGGNEYNGRTNAYANVANLEVGSTKKKYDY